MPVVLDQEKHTQQWTYFFVWQSNFNKYKELIHYAFIQAQKCI